MNILQKIHLYNGGFLLGAFAYGIYANTEASFGFCVGALALTVWNGLMMAMEFRGKKIIEVRK